MEVTILPCLLTLPLNCNMKKYPSHKDPCFGSSNKPLTVEWRFFSTENATSVLRSHVLSDKLFLRQWRHLIANWSSQANRARKDGGGKEKPREEGEGEGSSHILALDGTLSGHTRIQKTQPWRKSQSASFFGCGWGVGGSFRFSERFLAR